MRRVIFLCTGNSCRSQMAEGWLRHLGDGAFEVFSAGTHPAGKNPLALRAMEEVGVYIAGQESENIDKYVEQPFDYVITVCDRAKETCPVFPGGDRQLHWSFDDPAAAQGTDEERLPEFRRVRDEIRGRIEQFLEKSD
jgi:arsenate reductase